MLPPILRAGWRWLGPMLCLPVLCLSCLQAATPQVHLTVDKTTAAVGETIAITCSVSDAPAFVCWGATVLLPASGLAVTGHSPGTAVVFVPDSRGALGASVRFGGYSARPDFVSSPGGNYLLGNVTVRATAPGTYVIKAPSYHSSAQPYGAILLPKDSTAQVIPLPASDVTVTITGSGPINAPPQVDAGSDALVTLPSATLLTGVVIDDGFPGSSLTVAWSVRSGPTAGVVSFSPPTSAMTGAAFSLPGTYILRLTANDGANEAFDEVRVMVVQPTGTITTAIPTIGSSSGTATATPTLTGTAVPGATVRIRDGATVIGTVTANGSGAWTWTASPPLSIGSHTLTATAQISGQSESAPTAGVPVTVPTGGGGTVNVAPLVNAGPDTSVTLPATITLAGTVTDDGLPSGLLTVAWTTRSGPTSGVVDFGSPATATTTASFSIAGTYVLRLTGSDGAASPFDEVQVVVLPAGTVATATPTIGSSSGTTTATPTLTGTSVFGATVRIRDGSIVIGTVTADSSGAWTWTASPPLAVGSHSLTVTAQASGQSESAPTAAIPVTVPPSGGGGVPTPPTVGNGGSGGSGGCGLGSGFASLVLTLAGLLSLGMPRPRRRR